MRRSLVERLTCSSFESNEDRQLDEQEAAYVYGLAAFVVTEDADLKQKANAGTLFQNLRKMYLAQADARSSSMVLNASMNAFFCMESVWDAGQNGRARVRPSSLDEILNLACVDEKRWGTRVSNLVIRAAVAHTLGRHRECAKSLQNLTRQSSSAEPVIECHYGAFTYRPPTQETFEEIERTMPNRPTVEFYSTADKTRQDVILAAADPAYFKIYAMKLAASVLRYGNHNIHFHIMNPDAECFLLFGAMQKRFGAENLGMSYEALQGAVKAHFASVRYIRILEILESLQADIYVVDIDVTLARPPAALWKSFREYDCALLRRSGYPAYLPWRSVGAGVALFRWSEVGRKSAQIVSRCIDYLWHTFEGETDKCWWIDQNALFLATEFMKARSMEPGTIPTSIVRLLNHTHAEKQRARQDYESHGFLQN